MDVLRNASGAKYYSCEHCGQTKDTTSIYYTLYGTRYHSSRNCTELKEIFRKSVKTVSVTAGCAKSVRNKTGGADVKDIIFDYMACGDVIRRYKRRKINIISIVVMGSWYYYVAFSRRY